MVVDVRNCLCNVCHLSQLGMGLALAQQVVADQSYVITGPCHNDGRCKLAPAFFEERLRGPKDHLDYVDVLSRPQDRCEDVVSDIIDAADAEIWC